MTGANSVSVISTLASPCFRMKAIVSASSRMLSAFSTAPAIGTPKCASKPSGTFGAITATVSPRPMPRAARAEASRRQRSRLCRQVYRRAPWMTEMPVRIDRGAAAQKADRGQHFPVTTGTSQSIAYPAPGARPFRRDEAPLEPFVIVLFGATGDLAKRKLIPGMAYLDYSDLAPHIQVIGTSLEDLTDDEFRVVAKEAVDEFGTHKLTDEQWSNFSKILTYVPQSAGPEALAAAVAEAEARLGGGPGGAPEVQRLHYLSVPPKAARAVITMLRDANLVDRARVVMEKPFGTDLPSAVALNDFVHETFKERQIFRIDHFLGKEAAQNILAFRFANGLFEPIWNRNFIDHIQIDIPETLGLDERANFYESTGAYKDMVVTHLFQVMAFVVMEPPTALEPRAISEEKNKVFRSMLPIKSARCGPRPVRRVSPTRRCGKGFRYRDVHRAEGRHR